MIEIKEFYAVWCNPCKSYSKVLDKLSSVHPEVVINKYDIDSTEGDILVNKYGIRNIPYTVILKDDTEIYKGAGVLSYEELESKLCQ